MNVPISHLRANVYLKGHKEYVSNGYFLECLEWCCRQRNKPALTSIIDRAIIQGKFCDKYFIVNCLGFKVAAKLPQELVR